MDISNKKINFHIHTKYSFDSNLEPIFIVDHLVKNGYEIAIITDHNSIRGAIEAKDYALKKYEDRIDVIIGEEIQTNVGDIIGFPVKTKVEPGDYKKVIKDLKNQGAMLCLPHPYKSHNLFQIHNESFICDFDFVEVFNARIPDDLNSFAKELNNKFHKKAIIGTDAHVSSDLLNCSFVYDVNFNFITIETKKTCIRNIRQSQFLSSLKAKKIRGMIKYLFLYTINK